MKRTTFSFVVAGLLIVQSVPCFSQQSDLTVTDWIRIGEGGTTGAGLMLGGGSAGDTTSIAVGAGAYAGAWGSDASSIAMGINAVAYGYNCFALGNGAFARNMYQYDSDNFAVALGWHSYARDNSIAMGQSADSRWDSVAIGNFSDADNSSFALGTRAIAINASLALGYAWAQGIESTAIATYWGGAFGRRAVAIGYNGTAIGDYSFAVSMGGSYSEAHGNNSVALGINVHSVGLSSFALGKHNRPPTTSNSFWGFPADQPHPDNHFFVIGNGTSSNNRSNALVLTHNGDFRIPWQDEVGNPAPPSNGDTVRQGDHAFEVKSDGTVIIGKVQGDISMGIFGSP